MPPPEPRDVNLTPAELRAIEEHKYFLSVERSVEVAIEEAIDDFLHRFADAWRREKARRDILEQRAEIERFRDSRAAEEGRTLERSVAAREWCDRFARAWRAERESLERNELHRLEVVLGVQPALSTGFWTTIAELVACHDCDVFVHAARLPHWSFRLEGRPFLNVKPAADVSLPGIGPGEELEFIALGAQACVALDALRAMLEQP